MVNGYNNKKVWSFPALRKKWELYGVRLVYWIIKSAKVSKSGAVDSTGSGCSGRHCKGPVFRNGGLLRLCCIGGVVVSCTRRGGVCRAIVGCRVTISAPSSLAALRLWSRA